VGDLEARIVALALELEAAERAHDDDAMSEALRKLMQAARALQHARESYVEPTGKLVW
jgi:hypothetical protein